MDKRRPINTYFIFYTMKLDLGPSGLDEMKKNEGMFLVIYLNTDVINSLGKCF